MITALVRCLLLATLLVALDSQSAPLPSPQSTVRLVLPHNQDGNQHFIPQFEALYKQIGYRVIWVDIPLERGFIEMQKGNVDGFMFAPEMQPTDNSPLVFIRSLTTQKSIYLVCAQLPACSKGELFNPANVFLAPSIAEFFITNQKFLAKAYFLEELDTYRSLMLKDRFRFAIVSGEKLPTLFDTSLFSSQMLKTYSYYHAISAAHPELIATLSTLSLP